MENHPNDPTKSPSLTNMISFPFTVLREKQSCVLFNFIFELKNMLQYGGQNE